MEDPINIKFVKGSERKDGIVSGTLEETPQSAWGGPETYHLGHLHDVHPDFAAHIVKCVNTYAAIFNVAKAENGDGPITNALRELLTR